MKVKIVILVSLLTLLILVGCVKEESKECAICGGIANSTFSGPLTQMQDYGISVDECRQITSGIYTANVCSSCVSAVNPFDLPG